MSDTARNANLKDLIEILKDQETRRLDVVVPADKVRARDGNFVVKGAEMALDASGFTPVDGIYRPTDHFDSQLATKLGIPPSYLKKLRVEALDLYDLNVNGLLRGKQIRRANGEVDVIREADTRKFMARTFRGDNGTGVARALLSDRYNVIDNYDVLISALDGIRAAGVNVDVRSADLTDTRMIVKLHSPEVSALAPVLLGNYRNPFSNPELDEQRQHGNLERWRRIAAHEGLGYESGKEPVVFSGLRLSNSEVGAGAFSITPEIVVQVCRNGLTLPLLAQRSVHLGSKMSEGVVQWSDETQERQLALIKSKTADAVRAFLSPEFLAEQVGKLEEVAGKPVDKPVETIKNLGKALTLSQDEQESILNFFMDGGSRTAGGVAQAFTAFSQTLGDGGRADELDSLAVKAMHLV